tara:strand:+ start:47740 stop:48696 length:957 start_codon:yes stop_codon:yes gene_type:complete
MSNDSTSNIILCPGQGAQAIGMSKQWCDASQAAKSIFEQADEFLGDSLGAPLSELCFEGPADALNRTDISQPAIYTASIACFAGWLADENLTKNQLNMIATAGLSLGEYTALHLAGAFSFEDGLKLVALRGKAMQEAAQASPSSMVALIGADEEKANAVCDQARENDILVPANFNAPGQVVISGSATACDRAEAVASELGMRATRLAVAGAFHSPFMQPAADQLAEALAATLINTPSCTVMSNVTAQPHEEQPDSIRLRLVDQLTSPVRWSACCEHLIEANPEAQFHELAPGKTLGGMMRRIHKGTKVQNHIEPVTVA